MKKSSPKKITLLVTTSTEEANLKDLNLTSGPNKPQYMNSQCPLAIASYDPMRGNLKRDRREQGHLPCMSTARGCCLW